MAEPIATGSVDQVDSQAGAREDLGLTLGLVYRSYSRAATAVLEGLPGGTRGYHVLSDAVHGRAGSQAQLAQRLGVNRTIMTHLIDHLESAGLVERKADPSDRRNRTIVITAQGRELWENVQERLRAVEGEVVGVLDAGEQATFFRMLERLAERANRTDTTDDACVVGQDIERNPSPPVREE